MKGWQELIVKVDYKKEERNFGRKSLVLEWQIEQEQQK